MDIIHWINDPTILTVVDACLLIMTGSAATSAGTDQGVLPRITEGKRSVDTGPNPDTLCPITERDLTKPSTPCSPRKRNEVPCFSVSCCMRVEDPRCCAECNRFFDKRDEKRGYVTSFADYGEEEEGCGCCQRGDFILSCCMRCLQSKKK